MVPPITPANNIDHSGENNYISGPNIVPRKTDNETGIVLDAPTIIHKKYTGLRIANPIIISLFKYSEKEKPNNVPITDTLTVALPIPIQ